MHPGSAFKLWWDIMAVLALIFAVVFAPFRLAFDVEDYCPSAIWVVEALIDILFVLDLCQNFFTAVYITDAKTGDTYLSSRMVTIAKSYLAGWFWVDFVSSVPIDLVMSISVHGCVGNRAAVLPTPKGRLRVHRQGT